MGQSKQEFKQSDVHKKTISKTTFGCFLDQGPEQLSSETLEQHDDQTSVQCIQVVHSFSLMQMGSVMTIFVTVVVPFCFSRSNLKSIKEEAEAHKFRLYGQVWYTILLFQLLIRYFLHVFVQIDYNFGFFISEISII